MLYLLDTQVVSWFLQARKERELAAVAAKVSCSIVREVHDELAADPTRGPLFKSWFPGSHFHLNEIQLGSAAELVLASLRSAITSGGGLGERASIAVASTDPELVFAGMDKGGMWIALRELWAPGERLIALPVFLRRLVEMAGLPGETADAVMKKSN